MVKPARTIKVAHEDGWWVVYIDAKEAARLRSPDYTREQAARLGRLLLKGQS